MARLAEEDLVSPATVSETLRCPLCFEIFEDPVFWGGHPCQHAFCRECVEKALEQSAHCPSCRAEVQKEDLRSHLLVRSLLDEMLVRCSRSCGWTGRRDARPAHAAECPVSLLEDAKAELAGFADVRRQLDERDARIAELEARVERQDQQVVDVSRQLVAREVHIQELEARLARQDLLLAHCREGHNANEAQAATDDRQPAAAMSADHEDTSGISTAPVQCDFQGATAAGSANAGDGGCGVADGNSTADLWL